MAFKSKLPGSFLFKKEFKTPTTFSMVLPAYLKFNLSQATLADSHSEVDQKWWSRKTNTINARACLIF